MKCYGKILRISWTEYRMNESRREELMDGWENFKNQKADIHTYINFIKVLRYLAKS